MSTLLVIQMIISLLFILSVLLQKKSVWFSWALAWAYADNTSFYWNKRGFAKFLYISSVILAVLMFLNALLMVLV